MSKSSRAVAHDCATCLDCLHNGNECCGCYDGACCQPCEITPDGWCATHSTAAGPTYCTVGDEA